MAVPPDRFREQMELLAEGPYTAVTEDDLHTMLSRGMPLPENAVLLTFATATPTRSPPPCPCSNATSCPR